VIERCERRGAEQVKNDDTPLIPTAAWLEERLGKGSL
jgi:hypothetical protein